MTFSTTRRILIIDDQESIHHDYRKIMLPQTGGQSALTEAEAELFGNVAAPMSEWDLYEIDSAFQGTEAVDMVQKALAEGRPYAVAFVDIRMPPGCNGIETIRQMWQFDSELLVVICSAYSDYCWEEIVRDLGRTDRFLILRKPFENIEVRQCAAALSERWVIARTDVLTGLLNRRAFVEQLRREWITSVRHQQPISCVMVDVDYFKTVNDRFGHSVGDQALQVIAGQIEGSGRPGDVICRYGGEEFCILLPKTTEVAAHRWADALRQKIAQQHLDIQGTPLAFTASMGVASADENTPGAAKLVDQADAALRESKLAGRNRVTCWADRGGGTIDGNRIKDYAALFADMEAHQIMTSHVVCVQEEMNVARAAEILVQAGLSGLPVVNQDGQLTGMVSEKDLLEALGMRSSWSTSVRELMTSAVIQYERQTSAHVIFDFLCRVRLRYVVIVEGGKPVGLISRASFLRFIGSYLKTVEPASGDSDSRLGLFQAVELLMSRTTQLRDDLQSHPEEAVPSVMCGVSSIGVLLSDLLMRANHSKQKQGGDKLAQCL
ncbi:MAG: diguanylate cyclase [Pirellulaceae bacterium]